MTERPGDSGRAYWDSTNQGQKVGEVVVSADLNLVEGDMGLDWMIRIQRNVGRPSLCWGTPMLNYSAVHRLANQRGNGCWRVRLPKCAVAQNIDHSGLHRPGLL